MMSSAGGRVGGSRDALAAKQTPKRRVADNFETNKTSNN
jgi:hypothetical protein